MDYATYRFMHWPIGSGITEAACKVVFTQRFKLAGMTWNVESGKWIAIPEPYISVESGMQLSLSPLLRNAY